MLIAVTGPSPRIRGKSPRQCRMTSKNPWDHPREYGENATSEAHALVVHGTIPANTGKMIPYATHGNQVVCGPSPRIRGINDGVPGYTLRRGPSPRIRGKLAAHDAKSGPSCGTIPANTGKMRSVNLAFRHRRRTIPANTGKIDHRDRFEVESTGDRPANTGKIMPKTAAP